jgi:hypothetical protein
MKVMAVLVATVSLAALVLPSPAFAAGCSGSGCTGLDPHAQQCDTAAAGVATVTGIWHGDVSWELRGSSVCSARWAKATVDYGLITCCNTAYEFKIERQLWTPYGYYTTHNYSKIYYSGEEGVWWTKMVENSSSDRHRLCRQTYLWNGVTITNPSGWTCTGWYA